MLNSHLCKEARVFLNRQLNITCIDTNRNSRRAKSALEDKTDSTRGARVAKKTYVEQIILV